MEKIGVCLNLLFLPLVFWKTRFYKLLPAPELLFYMLLVTAIDIYTETRCPTPLCNTWKGTAYRAPDKLVKEWRRCDKLADIYRNFFFFFSLE